jgi:hypothetical protein
MLLQQRGKEERLCKALLSMAGETSLFFCSRTTDDEPEASELRCKRAAKLAAVDGHYVMARILREHKTG